MTASRTARRCARMLLWMGGLLLAGDIAAKSPPPLELRAGARIGLVTVLDAEVTHFHAAGRVQDNFLKTHEVPWRVDLMLGDALTSALTTLGLVPAPVSASEALRGSREQCFLDANLAKPLSRECAAPYAQLAATHRLDAIIVLGPGMNNSAHAGDSRRKELPEYLRGWCVLTDSRGATRMPALLNLTEMLVIAVTPQGPALAAREWGGATAGAWTAFAATPDPRLTVAQLAPSQPLFAAMLKAQAERLLAQLRVAR